MNFVIMQETIMHQLLFLYILSRILNHKKYVALHIVPKKDSDMQSQKYSK